MFQSLLKWTIMKHQAHMMNLLDSLSLIKCGLIATLNLRTMGSRQLPFLVNVDLHPFKLAMKVTIPRTLNVVVAVVVAVAVGVEMVVVAAPQMQPIQITIVVVFRFVTFAIGQIMLLLTAFITLIYLIKGNDHHKSVKPWLRTKNLTIYDIQTQGSPIMSLQILKTFIFT